ncbi:MAG TPA: AraC family transcriptional regulator [Bryobacteraceae bacterium]
MSCERLDRSDPVGVVWREALKGIFSTLGRLRALANCRNNSGLYHHDGIARFVGVQEADRSLRIVHEFVWEDWLSGSLEQQQADLFLHIQDFEEDAEAVLDAWSSSPPFPSFIPDSATAEQRTLFTSNLSILLALLRNQYCLHRPRVFPAGERSILEQSLQLLRAKYAEPALSLYGLAKDVGISERHLGRLFKKCTGKNFRHYLREFRLDKAITLLSQSAHDMKTIAGMVGYSAPDYFSRDFRDRMGCTPAEFRAKAGTLRSLAATGQPLPLAARF